MVALSGGIDSAVSAALLLRAGYDVEAAFMKNWSSTKGLLRNECPWLDDRREAIRVAAFLGIKLHTFDFEKQYQAKVMNYFFHEYSSGRTPNPDVMCNKEIKFGLLYDRAMRTGFDYLATGHYAQVKNGKLLRSADEFKDQTYFIYNIKQEQLNHVLFPVGKFNKSRVREMARKLGLPNAEREESMGLCFVGKIRLKDFLAQKIKRKSGDIVDTNGAVLGRHQGLFNYTIGQRQGLKIGSGGPYYVVSKDLAGNMLVVTRNPTDKALETRAVQISDVNWIFLPTKFPCRLKGRYRHQQQLQDLSVRSLVDGLYEVRFEKPQYAVASGQSLVLYKGMECVGGGVIQ